jgi:phospholipase C
MSGFIDNYANAPNITQQNVADVMTYLTPAQLPVTAFLAKQFGVCDEWFASVPTQTFTNRVFALCAAPGLGIQNLGDTVYSWVDDLQYLDASTMYGTACILSVLDDVLAKRGLPAPYWKLYIHDYSITMNTVPYVSNAAAAKNNVNVATFDNSDWSDGTLPPGVSNLPSDFLTDAANGTLPPFSFIEPRYSNNTAAVALPPNSHHPGSSALGFKSIFGISNWNPPIDVCSGEFFLAQVYNALAGSPCWNETLLIVTYDEPGGLYDSVAPPSAVPPATFNLPSPPDVTAPPSQTIPAAQNAIYDAVDGFNYDVYGGRVPAIVISPCVEPGSRIHCGGIVMPRHFDHTSIIKTVWEIFELGDAAGATSLTARDAAAASLGPYIAEKIVNKTGPFDASIILTSPGSFFFERDLFVIAPQTLFAVAASGATLTVTATVEQNNKDGQPWLSVASNPSTSNAWTVTASDDDMDHGVYAGSIVITADGCPTVTLPVGMQRLL